MKKLSIVLALIATVQLYAQTPESFNYQAVIRNADGETLREQSVGIQIAVLQGSVSGTTIYQETFTETTSASGLVTIGIGTGSTGTGSFAQIEWGDGPYFLQTAVDISGGTSYEVMGTTQLLSVPYAMYAKSAENGISTEQAEAIVANTDKVGITEDQASAIEANSAKTGITEEQASAIASNTEKIGLTEEQAAAITANSEKVGLTEAQASAIEVNTAKVGITEEQASAIETNSAKTGITSEQASAIEANSAKTGITEEQASAIESNSAKTGITEEQASAIETNSAKVGITEEQASAIESNSAKEGLTEEQAEMLENLSVSGTNTGDQTLSLERNTLYISGIDGEGGSVDLSELSGGEVNLEEIISRIEALEALLAFELECPSTYNLYTYNTYSNQAITVNYSNGDGSSYEGFEIQSTGNTSFTLTLASGTFAVGDGSLTLYLSGYSALGGDYASFAFSVGEESCELSFYVIDSF